MSNELVKRVINELRQKKNEVFQPTADIDLVWVLSGPGTYDNPPESGLYKDLPKDRERIDAGIRLVRQIVALRIDIDEAAVTKEMIVDSGIILYYNGEEQSQGAYPQNPVLRNASNESDFALPKSNVVISTLDEIYTPGQIKDLAKYLNNHPNVKKVAVVTHGPHQRRVARYVELYKYLLPSDVTFFDAAIAELDVPVGATLGEVKRIVRYAMLGHLHKSPAY